MCVPPACFFRCDARVSFCLPTAYSSSPGGRTSVWFLHRCFSSSSITVQKGEWELCFSELSTCVNPSQSPQNPVSPTCIQVLRAFLCGSFSYRSVHNPAKEQGLRLTLSLSLSPFLTLTLTLNSMHLWN